ncbi:MAG: hypothetical protein JW959_05110 [Pirellulales bacterium]|nr:hypothetical protein [Pirellulales bacterium]
MFRRFAPVVLLTACMLHWASFAPAAEDYMKLVPEDAMGVLVVNNPAAIAAKIQEFGQKTQMPIPPLMAMLDRFGVRKSINEKQAAVFAVLPPKNESGPPTPLVLIPVTDFEAFLAAFEEEKLADEPVYLLTGPDMPESYARHIGGYVALTGKRYSWALFTRNLKVADKAPANLAEWSEWLGGHDAAGVILPPGIKFVSSNVQKKVREMQTQMSGLGQTNNMATGLEVYNVILRVIEQEAAGYGVGLTLDKQINVVFNDRLLLKPDGELAGVVEKIHPMRMNLLAGLPDGKFVFAGGAYVPDEVMQAVMKFSTNMMASMREVYGLTDEQVEILSKLPTTPMKGIHAVSMSMLSEPVDDSIYSTMSGIMRVDDSAEFLKGYRRWMEQYMEVLKGIDSPMLAQMKVEATDFDGKSALKLTTSMPKVMAGVPEARQSGLMKTLFGPDEKLVAWLVPVDEHTVAMGYESKDFLRRAIKSVKDGDTSFAGRSELKQTAALLPSGAVAVGYLSPAGLLDFIKQTVSAVAPSGMGQMFPDFPETPPIGFAVTTGRNEVRCRAVVPFEVVRGAMSAWQQMMMYQFAPPPPPEVP